MTDVSRALAKVEWIEQKTIKASSSDQRVTFGVNDKSQFSLEAATKAIPAKYRKGVSLVEGPK